MLTRVFLVILCLAVPAAAKKPHTSAKHDVASGTADVGKGAASAATGTAKGALDLVTLHPINAATDTGKGAVKAGVGVTKGTGKVLVGAGKALKHLF